MRTWSETGKQWQLSGGSKKKTFSHPKEGYREGKESLTKGSIFLQDGQNSERDEIEVIPDKVNSKCGGGMHIYSACSEVAFWENS